MRASVPTWALELCVVVGVLGTVVVLTGGGLRELIGAAAVCVSFAHGQVSERLAAREAARTTPDVHCHRWVARYFVAKEALWCAYFAAFHAWSALVGVGLFLAYPLWRRWWRARHPRVVVRSTGHAEEPSRRSAHPAPGSS